MATTNGTARREASPLERFEALAANALMARADFWRQFADPRRDLNDECGYPKDPLAAYFYQDLYDREAVAARVVEVFPRECWQVQPSVYEDEDADTITPFEEAWDGLSKSLRGDVSHYQDEAGSAVWEYLRRADEQSGIGHYAVLVLGIDDGLPLDQPARILPSPRRGRAIGFSGVPPATTVRNAAPRRLLYLRVFPETLAEIVTYETDEASPRFGQPTLYNVTFDDPRIPRGGTGATTATKHVHWTRIVHLADGLTSSEIFGVPRMRPVLNRLLDIRKLYGGSAEMYWRGAFPGLSFETNPNLGGDPQLNLSNLRDSVEQYMNGLQRYLTLTGMTAKSLAPQVVDPKAQIEVQIEAICIKLGIPVRVFKGSERGELASSQDDAAWNDRLRERQKGYLTPRVIVPFVDRLIALGVLPEPSGYSVSWPDLGSQTAAEKATVMAQTTTALAAYVSGGVDALVPPLDYLTRFGGLTEEEAEAVLDNAEQHAEEKHEEEAALAEEEMERQLTQQEEEIGRGLVADPTQPPPGKEPALNALVDRLLAAKRRRVPEGEWVEMRSSN